MSQEYIHNYKGQYLSYKKKLSELNISNVNKTSIEKFDNDCFLKQRVALPTIIKYYDVLIRVAKFINKDFDKLNKKDYEDIVSYFDRNEVISISTKQKYRAVIKKFGRWLYYGDKIFNGMKEYPETISWINTGIKSKDMPKIKASDILTEKEVDVLISSVQHSRDKAFLSILYETGCRIGEIGGIRIKDLTEDKYGYLIDLAKGKTGERTVRIVFSSSKLSNWINQHPGRNDRNSKVWVSIQEDRQGSKHRKIGDQIGYRALYKIIHRAVMKAGIKKRIYPHLFRHSRVTHLLMNKQLNETQAKIYFGWVPSSDMIAQYSHLTSRDANDVMLEINGIKKPVDVHRNKALMCPSCGRPNDNKDIFCGFCTKPLSFSILKQIDDKKKKIDAIINDVIMKNPEIQKMISKAIQGK